jgi:hypothetical protein
MKQSELITDDEQDVQLDRGLARDCALGIEALDDASGAKYLYDALPLR